MRRTQIQFPDPLYQRIKDVAEMYDWALADVVRRAVELYVDRFPESDRRTRPWSFPTLDAGGDYLVDLGSVRGEADAITQRITG